MPSKEPHSKSQRAKQAGPAGSAAVAAPDGGPSGQLIVIWGALALYLVLFFASPLTSVGTSSPELLRRVQLWEPLLLADEICPQWITGCSWTSLAQRAIILAAAGAIFGTACAAGWISLQLLGLHRPLTRLERFVFSAGVGLNLTSLFTLALGLAGVLNRNCFAATGFAILATFAALVWRSRRRSAEESNAMMSQANPTIEPHGLELSPAWLWLSVPFMVVILFGAMLPPVDFDVREYHLQAPKEFYQAGRISFLPHNIYANMPLGTEMLSLLGMIVLGDWWTGALVGKTLIACFTPLTALALYAAGRRFSTPATGIVAALVYISIPWIALVSIQGLVEGGFAFYLFAALYAALAWREQLRAGQTSTRFLTLAGFLAGGAVSCKYPAVVFSVLPLAGWIVYSAWQAIRLNADESRCSALLPAISKPLGSFLIFVALGCGLWFAKNAVLTGNPTYPLLYSIFDGQTRTAENDQQWARAHRAPNYRLSDLVQRAADVTLASDWLSPLVMPLAALALVASSRRRQLAFWLIGYFGFVFLSWWLFTHRIDRFWVPALSIAAMVAGIGATWSNSKWWRVTLALFLISGLIFNFVVLAAGLLGDNRYLADLNILRTDSQRIDPWHSYLNEHASKVTGVLLVGDAQPFDLEVPVLYNTVFDASIFEQMARDRTPEQVRAALAERKISHIEVNWNEISRYRSPGNYGITDFIQPGVFESLVAGGVLTEVPAKDDHSGQLFRVLLLPQSPD